MGRRNRDTVFISIAICIAGLFNLVSAQKDSCISKWSICGGAGAGNPMEKFSNENLAEVGPTGMILATDEIPQSIYGLSFMLSYNTNNFNLDEYLNSPDRGLGNPPSNAIKNGNYKEISALTGFSISTRKNQNKGIISFRFLVGAIYSVSPYMEYITSDTIPEHISIYPTGYLSFCIDVGINIKFPVYRKVFAFFDFNYFLGGAGWNLTEHISNSYGTSKQSYTDDTGFEILSYGGGIGYWF